jgi:hypothetical protein
MELDELQLANTTDTVMKTFPAMRVRTLDLSKSLARDVTPLRAVQMQRLILTGSAVTDLAPLLACAGLEELMARDCAAPIEPLRAHKTLKTIEWSPKDQPSRGALPAAQFWAEYDAQQQAGRK